MVLSSGPGTYQGISASTKYLPEVESYHLLVKLITSDSIYQILAPDFELCGKWVNVGIVASTEDASKDVHLEVYKNGLAFMATSLPVSRSPSAIYQINPSPGIYFGSAITTIAGMAAAPIASGMISTFSRFGNY